MTPQRIAEIYDKLTEIFVRMDSDPRVQGPLYILSKITEAAEKMLELNELWQETEKSWAQVRNQVRSLEFELKQTSDFYLGELRELSVSFEEKRVISRQKAVQRIRVKRQQENPNLPENAPSIEDEILQAKNLEEDLRALRSAIEDKKAHVKQVDSGIRLQEKTMNEERASSSRAQPRNMRATFRPEATEEWSQLAAEPANIQVDN